MVPLERTASTFDLVFGSARKFSAVVVRSAPPERALASDVRATPPTATAAVVPRAYLMMVRREMDDEKMLLVVMSVPLCAVRLAVRDHW
jgi:hypothetical protein